MQHALKLKSYYQIRKEPMQLVAVDADELTFLDRCAVRCTFALRDIADDLVFAKSTPPSHFQPLRVVPTDAVEHFDPKTTLVVLFGSCEDMMAANHNPFVLPAGLDSLRAYTTFQIPIRSHGRVFTDAARDHLCIDDGFSKVSVGACCDAYMNRLARYLFCNPLLTHVVYLARGPPEPATFGAFLVEQLASLPVRIAAERAKLHRALDGAADLQMKARVRRQFAQEVTQCTCVPAASLHPHLRDEAGDGVISSHVYAAFQAGTLGRAACNFFPLIEPEVMQRCEELLVAFFRGCVNARLLRVLGTDFTSLEGDVSDMLRHIPCAVFVYGSCWMTEVFDDSTSMPVPTGWKGVGFQSLDEEVEAGSTARECIDAAIRAVAVHLAAHEWVHTVYFNKSGRDGYIGCGVAEVGLEVREYITCSLYTLKELTRRVVQ